jgi:peptide/nickel transport system substrate-binding protein
MQTRRLRVIWQKRLRKSQRQVKDIGLQTEDTIEEHLLSRFDRLIPVRRFVATWLGAMLLIIAIVFVQFINLSSYYQKVKTVPGGIYVEGSNGTYTNANPIYATTDPDNTISSLIFASLFKDGSNGKLVGDLASGYTTSDNGKTYIVNLKPNLTWQDGKPLTSADVVFTFNTIENPDADSPLFPDWQGINVSASSPTTVVFKLPDVLASFPYELTTGIIPQHILGQVPVADLKSTNFDTIKPVGSGPFSWQAIQVINGDSPDNEEVQIALKPFTGYNGGKPKLDEFIEDIYANQNQLVSAFQNQSLTAMEATTPPPEKVQNKSGVVKHSFIERAASMVFFKTTSGELSDQSIRTALVEGANVPDIISHLGYSTKQVNEPLLMGQLGYNSSYAQPKYNLADAIAKLQSDGWTTIKNGVRYKNGAPLTFTLSAANNTENRLVTSKLKSQWDKLGLDLNVQLLDPADLLIDLNEHNYDAVLTSISIGVDPDVYVYWDSAEADIRSTTRLNFSEFSSSTADESLQAGRTRLSPLLRVIKYEPFLQAWQQAEPALGLYQPRLLYLTNGVVGGLNNQELSVATDRFENVQNWEIKEARVTIKSPDTHK